MALSDSFIDVIEGYAAIGQLGRQRRYWVGVASGNRWCSKRRCTPEKALEDARKLEGK